MHLIPGHILTFLLGGFNMNINSNPNPQTNYPKRLISINEAMVYLGVGRSSALKFLDDIGAKRKIGRRTLYDKVIIDQHFNKEGANKSES